MRKKYKRIAGKNRAAVLLLLGLLSVSPLQAQKSHLGLMGGFAGATMTGSYIRGSSGPEMGFHFFGMIDREFSERWALEAGVSWMQKGGKKLVLSDHSGEGETYGFQTSYLQVPVLARITFPISGGPWFFAPFAGAALGANVGCKHKEGDRFEFEEEPCDENSPGGKPKTLELSIPFGVYLWHEFPGESRVLLGLKYEVGLTNAFTAAEEFSQAARNNVFLFLFGFALPL